jgi:thiol-disulfide isomerase/thioredoxin
MRERTADPYADLAVIDARAPRFNQAVVGGLSLLAVTTGWWPILGVLAAQLAIGLRFGRRYCLPCAFYFEVVQPRFGEGPLEDSRPPRFANMVGVVFLSAAALAYAVGLARVGAALGLSVAVLALLAMSTGLCVGCEIYRLFARWRGVAGRAIEQLDLTELGAASGAEVVVQFTHPWCADCQELARRLDREGRPVVQVDVSKRPDLAKKYGVTLVPLAFAVDGRGVVRARVS